MRSRFTTIPSNKQRLGWIETHFGNGPSISKGGSRDENVFVFFFTMKCNVVNLFAFLQYCGTIMVA